MDFRLVENLIAKRFQVRDRDNPDEVVDFIPNPAQRRLLALCQKLHDEKRRLRIISVKSRRVGFSRIVEAIACCYMFAYPNFEGRVMAHFDETAADILSSAALMVYGDGSPGKGIPQRGRTEFWESDREYKSVTVQHKTRAGRGVSRLLRASAKVRGKGRGLGFSFYHGCLSADSQVVMEDGNTLPISEVRPGMKICTHGGTFAKVLRFIPQPEPRPTLRIKTWLNGEPLTVTANHKIFTSRGWVCAGDLTLRDEVGVPIPRENDLSRGGLLDLDSVRHPKKGKGLIRGQIPLDREFGFFVGHYLAEGWIKNQYKPQYGPTMPSSIQLGCHINERSFVDRSLRAISKFSASSKVEEDRAHNKLIVTIYGGSLAQLIDREFGRKDEKRIPDWIFKTSAEFRIGVMLGYVAGDGSKKIDRTARYENAAISITSVRKRLLVQYRRMMASVGWGYAGLHAKSEKPDKRGWRCQKAYTLRINGDAADRIRREFAGVIFETADFSRRSQNRANAATKYRLDEGVVWLKIRSIEDADIQPVYDIEVDHPDHSFDTSIGAVANSESAYYPEDSPFTAVLPALAKSPDRSFAALESTGNGVVGDGEAFYKYWQQASDPDKLGDSEWVRFFVPWTEDPYAVTNAVPKDIPRDDEEKILVKIGLTARQIAWRRIEIATTYQGIVEDFNVECLTGDTLISTARGIIPMSLAMAGDITESGMLDALIDQGVKSVFTVTTAAGRKIIGTADHPLKRAGEGYVPLAESIGIPIVLKAPRFAQARARTTWREKPFELDEQMGLFLGLFIGDGSFYANSSGWPSTVSLRVAPHDLDVLKVAEYLWDRLFEKHNTRFNNGAFEVRSWEKEFAQLLKWFGAFNDTAPFKQVCVPRRIFESPKEIVAAFLRGLFEADGYNHPKWNTVQLHTKSGEFARQIQLLLLGFEIESRVSSADKPSLDYVGYRVTLNSKSAIRFNQEIGFLSERKRANAVKTGFAAEGRTGSPASEIAMTDTVVAVEPSGEASVYDIRLDRAPHTFSANGLCVHNCPLTPEDAFLAGGSPSFAREEQDYANSTVRPPIVTCELERTREPFVIKMAPMGTRGRIKIWELPAPGMEYYAGVDLARGEDMKADHRRPGDYAAITVFNGTTGEQAASFCDRIDPSKMADLLDKLGRFYRTPEISPSHCAYLNIEMNANLGTECQRQLRDRYAYPAWRFPRWRGSKDDRYNRRAGTAIGWETTGSSRNLMFAAFRSSLRERAFAIRDEELARQVCASTMHDGRWEITHGHDDLLVSALLAWITRQQFPPQRIVPRKDLPDRPHPLAQFEGAMFPMVEELARTEEKEMQRMMDPRKRNADRDPLFGVLTKGILE